MMKKKKYRKLSDRAIANCFFLYWLITVLKGVAIGTSLGAISSHKLMAFQLVASGLTFSFALLIEGMLAVYLQHPWYTHADILMVLNTELKPVQQISNEMALAKMGGDFKNENEILLRSPSYFWLARALCVLGLRGLVISCCLYCGEILSPLALHPARYRAFCLSASGLKNKDVLIERSKISESIGGIATPV